MKSLGLPFVKNDDFPTTAEEYAVLAIRLHSDENLKASFRPMKKLAHSYHGDEILYFLEKSRIL